VDDEPQVLLNIISSERLALEIPDFPGLRWELSGESRRWRLREPDAVPRRDRPGVDVDFGAVVLAQTTLWGHVSPGPGAAGELVNTIVVSFSLHGDGDRRSRARVRR